MHASINGLVIFFFYSRKIMQAKFILNIGTCEFIRLKTCNEFSVLFNGICKQGFDKLLVFVYPMFIYACKHANASKQIEIILT